MPLKLYDFVRLNWGTPTNLHYKPQTLNVRIEKIPTGTTDSAIGGIYSDILGKYSGILANALVFGANSVVY